MSDTLWQLRELPSRLLVLGGGPIGCELAQAFARTGSQVIQVVKVLTVPGKDRILGATIVGQHAGEMLTEFVLAMRHGLGLNKILDTIHAYPTWAEANKYAAGNWKKTHAPTWVLAWLERCHAWRLK